MKRARDECVVVEDIKKCDVVYKFTDLSNDILTIIANYTLQPYITKIMLAMTIKEYTPPRLLRLTCTNFEENIRTLFWSDIYHFFTILRWSSFKPSINHYIALRRCNKNVLIHYTIVGERTENEIILSIHAQPVFNTHPMNPQNPPITVTVVTKLLAAINISHSYNLAFQKQWLKIIKVSDADVFRSAIRSNNLEFLLLSPHLITSDNVKKWVDEACRYAAINILEYFMKCFITFFPSQASDVDNIPWHVENSISSNIKSVTPLLRMFDRLQTTKVIPTSLARLHCNYDALCYYVDRDGPIELFRTLFRNDEALYNRLITSHRISFPTHFKFFLELTHIAYKVNYFDFIDFAELKYVVSTHGSYSDISECIFHFLCSRHNNFNDAWNMTPTETLDVMLVIATNSLFEENIKNRYKTLYRDKLMLETPIYDYSRVGVANMYRNIPIINDYCGYSTFEAAYTNAIVPMIQRWKKIL